ncbi:MAG: methylmalonyl Co-A mutase-associated GTPase MeaB [Alphaproteobacteria bacterium]
MDIEATVAAIGAGDRRALGRAITLVESVRADHRAQATELLQRLLPDTGQARRIGISGAPGVGKSTFIEAFGRHLIEQGLTVAVLAVDPSSARAGGSILGDKTRMPFLARHRSAFIRPTPAGTTLGGVARRTADALLLTEAAGFDVVIVETVGVGQSEIAVADLVDTFVLLLSPGGGDDLQGIKRGIMELADIVVVNKADGALADAAGHAAADYRAALALMRPKIPEWPAEVLLASALNDTGIAETWDAIQRHRDALGNRLADLRAGQATRRMWAEVHDSLVDALRQDTQVKPLLAKVERAVGAGEITPSAAAAKLVGAFRRG